MGCKDIGIRKSESNTQILPFSFSDFKIERHFYPAHVSIIDTVYVCGPEKSVKTCLQIDK